MKLLRFLIPCAVVGTPIGALLFKLVGANFGVGLLGGITRPLPAQRLRFPPRPDSPPLKWLGELLQMSPGFSSFAAHAGGTALSAGGIPLRLSPSSSRPAPPFLVRNQSVQVDFPGLAWAAASVRCGFTGVCVAACFPQASSCCGMDLADTEEMRSARRAPEAFADIQCNCRNVTN